MIDCIVEKDPYALATGATAVNRLYLLQEIYWPAGKGVLLSAGLKEGMNVADLGCGVGVVTRTMAELVGPSGHVTGVDVSTGQLDEAKHLCRKANLLNASFVAASASATGLPRHSFDLVYCRFLLLHLPDPSSCLQEMKELLKPGGIIVVEDGDLATAGCTPPGANDEFAEFFCRFGPTRGLNDSLAKNLYHMVKATGFCDIDIQIHRPVLLKTQDRYYLKWSVEEAGPSFVKAGIVTSRQLEEALAEMQTEIDDPNVLILAPRMSIASARKPM